MKNIYIAGPMSGYPQFNYPAFFEAASEWRRRGWEVFNPAIHQPDAEIIDRLTPDEIRAYFMRLDIPWVMQADAIAMLPGWKDSPGAMVEYSIADILLLPAYDAHTGEPINRAAGFMKSEGWREGLVREVSRTKTLKTFAG